MPEITEPVTVRLPTSIVTALKEAAQEAGTNLSDFLRPVLVRALDTGEAEEGEELGRLREEITRLTQAVESLQGDVADAKKTGEAVQMLRGDLATAVAGIMAYVSPALPPSQQKTPEQITEWVKQRFGIRGG